MSTGPNTLAAHPRGSAADAADVARVARDAVREQIARVWVGPTETIDLLFTALLARGHVLLEGVPGIAKTTLVKAFAATLGCAMRRIQFTPDLLPADITGTEILTDNQGHRELRFVPGPVFANVILADEINRTPPKTQSALLEAMQEHQVTAAGKRYGLPKPFFVLATQNPIEMEGTYPLPEAQLDRFMFNVLIDYLPFEDELKVVLDTTSRTAEPIEALFDAKDILQFQALVRKVPVAQDVARYAVRLVSATRPNQPNTPQWVNDSITWGAGLRAAQMLVLGAKARAILHGKTHARFEDIRSLAPAVLRHRLLLSYKAEAQGMTVEDAIEKLLSEIPCES